MRPFPTCRAVLALGLASLIGVAGSGCASGPIAPVSVAEQEADAFLFKSGQEALEKRRWLTAREYFRRLVDTYPTSQFRQDAKLGVGDSYLGEGRVESDILAAGEFREFLRFYPLAARADYAQYRLAVSQVRQVLGPQRDQTATLDALRELDAFMTSFPSSQYMPEVVKLRREMRDRLSESELLVGRHYYRTRLYVGSISRLEALLKTDPEYAGRDRAYYYLAESYYAMDRKDEARPYYQKLVDEFAVSEFREDAQERLTELASTPAAPATPPTAVAEGPTR